MLRPKNTAIQNNDMKTLPLNQCLAKTVATETGKQAGVDVETHCLIVGLVARALIKRMPDWFHEKLFPLGVELVAAAHDVGKVSPGFQQKIYGDLGINKELCDTGLDKHIGYHYAVSQAALEISPKYIPSIVGRHHGYSPHPQSIVSPDAEIYGGSEWQKIRMELIHHLKQDLIAEWPNIDSSIKSDVIAGLTTVADWIGSGSLFDIVNKELSMAKIEEALDLAGFVVPHLVKGLSFVDVFGFSAFSVQTQLIESVSIPGVYVLEAPMGIGKTEAALFAAYKALERGQATGIYFALPTQLTSDKIHERMSHFLEKIIDKDVTNQGALLLHGSAWLRQTELGVEGAPGASWFNSIKRGLLAPYAVGTIDQALMAVMNVKHGFVRTFGLAGKVVILDEVHSYDSYTGTILKELVSALRELQCTVIILSATLTDFHRRSILGVKPVMSDGEKNPPYPLISKSTTLGNLAEIVVNAIPDNEVKISLVQDDRLAIDEVLIRAERGEQVLWVENTVKEAQEIFEKLAVIASQIGLACGLLHSRFTKNDREENEREWVGLYGKEGHFLRHKTGRILIGTQVLEQSLDIDADFLVTRLCPTDMLFQRLGRLWRHRSNDPIRAAESVREVWVLAPELTKAIENQSVYGATAQVYSSYVLCRTQEVWQHVDSVNLPGDIRRILESTYSDRFEEGRMARYKQELEKERGKLSGLALIGVSRGGSTLPETKASTRYSEKPSVELLLVRNIRRIDNGMLIRLLDDSELPVPKYATIAARRQIAITLLKNSLSVPEYMAPSTPVKNLSWLKDYVYLGDDVESPFRVAIVQDSDELRGIDQSEASSQYVLRYDNRFGYRAIKKGREELDEESF